MHKCINDDLKLQKNAYRQIIDNNSWNLFTDIYLSLHMRIILILSLITLVSAACSERHNNDTYSIWSPTDPEFDNAVRCIDKAYAHVECTDSIRDLTFRLADLAEEDPTNPVKAARAAFFKARYYDYTEPYTEAWNSKAQNEINKAYKIYGTDTTNYPYDLFRLRFIRNKLKPLTLERQYYENVHILKEAIEFGDSLATAAALNNIGLVHLSLGDSLTAISYFNDSQLLYHKLGLERMEKRSQLSIAQANIRMNPQLYDSIMTDLYTDALAKRDTLALTIILHNKYVKDYDPRYIAEAYELVRNKPGFENAEAYYKNIIASGLLASGQYPDSARMLARSAIRQISPSMLPEYVLSIYKIYASVLESENKLDSAVLFLRMSLAMQDSISQVNALNQVAKNIMHHKISESRNATMKAQMHDRIMYACVIIAILFIAMVIIILLFRRHNNLKQAKIESELQLTRNQLQLASSLLVVKENENAIDTTVKTIKELMDDGRIQYADGIRVYSALKAHLNNHAELDTFQKVYADIHPEFTGRLLELCPNLSENQIRLAKYIAMGMDNRQISRVMRIEYKSLITARYRLRTKLGLSKEDSLESLLYRLAKI